VWIEYKLFHTIRMYLILYYQNNQNTSTGTVCNTMLYGIIACHPFGNFSQEQNATIVTCSEKTKHRMCAYMYVCHMHMHSCVVAIWSLNVTGFHINRLPHTQNQTYHFTRNRLQVQYTFTLHAIFRWRIVGVLFVAAFSWPCDSREWMIGAIQRPWLYLNYV